MIGTHGVEKLDGEMIGASQTEVTQIRTTSGHISHIINNQL